MSENKPEGENFDGAEVDPVKLRRTLERIERMFEPHGENALMQKLKAEVIACAEGGEIGN